MYCLIYVIMLSLHMTSNLFVLLVDNIPTGFMFITALLFKHLYVMIDLIVNVHILCAVSGFVYHICLRLMWIVFLAEMFQPLTLSHVRSYTSPVRNLFLYY